jgi:hypothetical protein
MITERHLSRMSGFETSWYTCALDGGALSIESRERLRQFERLVYAALFPLLALAHLNGQGGLLGLLPVKLLVVACSTVVGYVLVSRFLSALGSRPPSPLRALGHPNDIPLDSIQYVEITSPPTRLTRRRLRIWHGDERFPEPQALVLPSGLFGDADEAVARAKATFEEAGIPVVET